LNIYFYTFVGTITAICIWQLIIWLNETRDKRRKYREAACQAEKAGKPLLVAGGPWGALPLRYWLRIPAHGGGDVCLDIDWHALRGHESGVVSDIKYIPFQEKSFGAIFASHILEHLDTVDDAAMAINEFKRISDAVYIVSPSRQSIAARIRNGHHLWLWQKGNVVFIKQRGKEGKYRSAIQYFLPPVR